ncbi:MAG: ABC transporter substrate-binding protein, partial [Spirochaetales bacterium]|nr:ABC transporter substrate-binding protein [Spirochaetales bacterium]
MRIPRGFIAWFVVVALLLPATTMFARGAAEPEQEQRQEQAPATRSPDPVETTDVSVVVPSGVPAIGVGFLASGALPIEIEGYETSFEIVTSPDVMGARLLSGEADIAVVPTNLGARLYNQDVPVQLAGVVVWGILYVVSADPIDDWEDLKGSEIGMLGRGLTPDIVFRHLARKNGLDPDGDLTLRYVNASTELAPNFITGTIDVSIMPEPMLTMVMGRAPNAVVAFDLQK